MKWEVTEDENLVHIGRACMAVHLSRKEVAAHSPVLREKGCDPNKENPGWARLPSSRKCQNN